MRRKKKKRYMRKMTRTKKWENITKKWGKLRKDKKNVKMRGDNETEGKIKGKWRDNKKKMRKILKWGEITLKKQRGKWEDDKGGWKTEEITKRGKWGEMREDQQWGETKGKMRWADTTR